MQLMRTLPRDVPSLQLWMLLVGVAHGLDILTTAIGLRLGIREDNPFLGSVMHRHGELAMYSLKILIVACLIFAIVQLQRRFRRVWPMVLTMTGPAFLVVVHNIVLIAEAHG